MRPFFDRGETDGSVKPHGLLVLSLDSELDLLEANRSKSFDPPDQQESTKTATAESTLHAEQADGADDRVIASIGSSYAETHYFTGMRANERNVGRIEVWCCMNMLDLIPCYVQRDRMIEKHRVDQVDIFHQMVVVISCQGQISRQRWEQLVPFRIELEPPEAVIVLKVDRL